MDKLIIKIGSIINVLKYSSENDKNLLEEGYYERFDFFSFFIQVTQLILSCLARQFG